MLFNISLPELSDSSDSNNTELIRGYLATLNDQLRYMMLNIDEDNLSENLSNTINSASSSSNALRDKVNTNEKKITSLTKKAAKIDWIIASGNGPSDFSLTDRAFLLLTKGFDLKNYVTQSNLETEGGSVLNGANISDNTITPEKLSVPSLEAVSTKLGGWNVSKDSISSSSGEGSFFLNSAGSNDSFWLKAVDKNSTISFFISKDGSCFIHGNSIAENTVTHNKLPVDSSLKTDLSGNVNGLKIGKELSMNSQENTCRMYISEMGNLTFETGKKSLPFSLTLTNTENGYTLSVLDEAGSIIGNIPMQV